MKNKQRPIDFVITWVDGNDPEWKAEKEKYMEVENAPLQDISDSRYRPSGSLKFLFRGIEKYASWVNKVYFVTSGHVPEWLNTNNPKLVVVKHSEFVPAAYLPTFNVAPIEFNLHRIKGLSECFVYFNDDMFIINKTRQSDFFINNFPCDSAVFNAVSATRIDEKKMYLKPLINMAVINSHFRKKATIKAAPLKWFNLKYGTKITRTLFLLPWRHFTGFENWHLPYSLCKSVMREVWQKEKSFLDEVCSHKFRRGTDANIWLITYWQYASNRFVPRSPFLGTRFSLTEDEIVNRKLLSKAFSNKKIKLLCINDDFEKEQEFEKADALICEYMEKTFPNKSTFEL